MKAIEKKIINTIANNEELFQSILDKLNEHLDYVSSVLNEVQLRSYEYEIGYISYLRDLSKKVKIC